MPSVKSAPKDVDEYIEKAPKESQGKLGELRAAILEVAPNASVMECLVMARRGGWSTSVP